jgi:hypothetical protein
MFIAGSALSLGPDGILCEPFGTVTHQGTQAPDGLLVQAVIDGTVWADGETENGEYSLAISQDDPGTPEKEGWADGDVITIRVEETDAFPSFEAFSGRARHDVSVSSSGVVLDTWGRIKALFR